MASALNLPGIGFRVISDALTPGGGSPLHSGVLKPATDSNRVRSVSPPPLLPTLSAAAANNLPATSQSTTLLPLVTNTSHLHPTPPLHPTYITRLNPAPHTHYASSPHTLTLASSTAHIHSLNQLALLPLSLLHITHPANRPLPSAPQQSPPHPTTPSLHAPAPTQPASSAPCPHTNYLPTP
nr:unnamed protein product [Spirometra erinaceieuropaei]